MNAAFMESERLQYRAPELTDAETFTQWINDARIRIFLDTRVFPVNLLAEQAWVRESTELAPNAVRTNVIFVFGKKGEDRIIGSTGLHGINWITRDAEWGILIGDPEEWDRGYGREVARRIVAYAFSSLNLNRVRLRVNASHPRGIACYESAGFIREGVMRQASYLDGRYDDQLMMAILRDDWIQQRLPPPSKPESKPAAPPERSTKRKRSK